MCMWPNRTSHNEQPRARAAKHAPHPRPGLAAYRYVSAVSAEIVVGTVPEKRLSFRVLRRNVLVQTPESVGRPHGGGRAYKRASLVSAMMLAGMGPVKLLWATNLITHSEACGRIERTARAQPREHAQRSMRRTPGPDWQRTGT